MPELQQRFKKKETSSPVTNYIPTRLREAADSQEVQMSGFLKWKRGKGAGWKKNWFVLKDRVLYTFKAVNDKVATDTRPVLGWTLETLSDVSYSYHDRLFHGKLCFNIKKSYLTDYHRICNTRMMLFFSLFRKTLSCMRVNLQAWCSCSPTPDRRASSSAQKTTTWPRSG